jgi:NADH-quinone oxidoreductase subunit M
VTLAVLMIPLLGGLLVALIRFRPLAQRAASLLVAILTFVVALFLPGSEGVERAWIPSFGTYFSLSANGAAGVLVLVSSLVMIPTVLYAGLRIRERTGAFLALLLLMQAGLNGLFLAKDLVLFYVFWEATLIPSLMMLGIWGRDGRRQATLKYLIYAVAGSLLMLVTILAIKPISGAESYRLADLLAVTPALSLHTQVWLFLGFSMAFAVKLPLWPLHTWLPDFHAQNHPSGVADVAGTLYKVGGYGFFAWALPLLPAAASVVAPFLLVLAAFTAIYGAMVATAQNNLKRLLAFASLSHMGIVGVGLFGLHLAGLNGAVYLLAAQMFTTGGLFLVTGMLFERQGSFKLDKYGGLARSSPALAAVTLFVLFASIGVPGLANFPGEFLSLLGAFQANPAAAVVAVLAVIASAIYGVNLFQRLYQGNQKNPVRDLSPTELFVLIPILSGILWLGIAPAPQLERIELQSRAIVNQTEVPPSGLAVGGDQ